MQKISAKFLIKKCNACSYICVIFLLANAIVLNVLTDILIKAFAFKQYSGLLRYSVVALEMPARLHIKALDYITCQTDEAYSCMRGSTFYPCAYVAGD